MLSCTVEELARVTGGTIVVGELSAKVSDLTFDSRTVTPGCVFVAFPGERVDGNDFTVAALAGGAAVALVTRDPDDALRAFAGEMCAALIVIDDGPAAITDLAAFHREKLSATVIGVTGSSGKTTTKDILAAVLGSRFVTVATVANRNNELGVPLTVLSANPDTEILIVEMGMRGFGQIERLCKFVRPDYAVISNIGVSHMELLGSREGIARAKSELITALPIEPGHTGRAFLNADNDFTPFLISEFAAPRGIFVTTFGFSFDADVRGSEPVFDAEGYPTFEMTIADEETVDVTLSLQGRHNVSNALSAAAVAFELGMGASEIAEALSVATGSAMRLQTVTTTRGVTVLNDAYNANPDSVSAALDVLAMMEPLGKRFAVLGDMGELGADAPDRHHAIGVKAAKSGLSLLVTIGELSRRIADGAVEAGMNPAAVIACDSADEAVSVLMPQLSSGDLVLVKASRSMGLEHVVKGIVD